MRAISLKQAANQTGFSIIEILIAALIASIAITAGFGVLIDANKSHVIQTRISDMQQNGRAAMDEVVNTLRQAGYRVPIGVKCIFSKDTNPDTIAVSYLSEPLCTTTLSVSMPDPGAELTLKSDISMFSQGSWAYIYDPNTATGEYFYISVLDAGSKKMQHNEAPMSKPYPQGSRVFTMDFVKFYIDNSADTLHPKFVRVANGEAPEVFCNNISDLQCQYTNANGAVFDTVIVDRYVREIKVQLVALTDNKDLFLHKVRADTMNSRVMIRNLEM